MAVSKLVVRPSCKKNIRCPTPQNGAVRNWSPPAPPCDTLSAKPVPMWWISMSENAPTCALASEEVMFELWVELIVGVWQVAHPMDENNALPVEIAEAPPGVVVEGIGGASRRMNSAKSTISEGT